MGDKVFKVKIKVDGETKNIAITKQEFDKLESKVKSTSNTTSLLKENLLRIGGTVAGIYAVGKAFESVTKSGFTFNSSLERSIAGLQALSVATSSNIDSLNRPIDRTNLSATLRLLWQPGYNLNLGIETGWMHISHLKRTQIETPFGITEARAVLAFTPILLIISKKILGFDLNKNFPG